MSELEQLRGDIDAIDRQIVDLMKRRMETVAQVAEYKKANNRWGRKSTYRNGNYFVGCAHLVFL